jgi:hypothetical protein
MAPKVPVRKADAVGASDVRDLFIRKLENTYIGLRNQYSVCGYLGNPLIGTCRSVHRLFECRPRIWSLNAWYLFCVLMVQVFDDV